MNTNQVTLCAPYENQLRWPRGGWLSLAPLFHKDVHLMRASFLKRETTNKFLWHCVQPRAAASHSAYINTAATCSMEKWLQKAHTSVTNAHQGLARCSFRHPSRESCSNDRTLHQRQQTHFNEHGSINLGCRARDFSCPGTKMKTVPPRAQRIFHAAAFAFALLFSLAHTQKGLVD